MSPIDDFEVVTCCNSFNSIQTFQNQKAVQAPPNIISIATNYPKKGTWVQIPKGTKKITFNVKAENTKTVLFWLVPTGSGTWSQRKLIGYDIKEDDGIIILL